jgi:hypothetical protein
LKQTSEYSKSWFDKKRATLPALKKNILELDEPKEKKMRYKDSETPKRNKFKIL